MLIGEFDSKITENSRIALPKKFRNEIGKDLIIMNGYEGCLIIVDLKRFEALTKEIIEGKFINDSIRDSTRFLIGSAQELTLDSQGRFVLPQSLKEYSGLNENGVFLGLIRWVELWDKTKWQERKDFIAKNATQISSKLDTTLTKP